MNEKKEIEFYNYLIKMLSLFSEYFLFSEKKEELVKTMQQKTMEILNYFENVNFNKPNYFYKDYIETPTINFLFFIYKEDKILFKKDDSKFKLLRFYPSPVENIPLTLSRIFNEELKLDFNNEFIKSNVKLENIESIIPFEDSNDKNPISQYIFIFSLELDKISKINLESFSLMNIKENINIDYLNLNYKEVKRMFDKIKIKD